MYLGFYNFYRHYNANRMFTDPSSPIGDDLMYPLVYLGKRLRELGHRVATLDMDAPEAFDVAVFLDHPTVLNPLYRKLRQMPGKKLYLFLMENEANRPDNYWPGNHRDFEKVFTWSSTLVDGKKYHKLFLPLRIPEKFAIDRQAKTKFCVTVASQKYSGHPKELYSERVRAIRWFEAEHPGEFDLYGTSWDRLYFSGGLSRLNLLLQKCYSTFPKLGKAQRFPSWRGTVTSKNAVMRQYRFAIAYENAVFPGYLTEKIFDALFAGCIPVYMGDPEVSKYVPAETFIDLRNFKGYPEVYKYMKGMSESEYQQYLAAIETFVRGEKVQLFGPEKLAQTVLENIVQPHTKA